MGRKRRVEFAGAIFHVWARRVDRWPLFVDDEDFQHYMALLKEVVEDFGWILLSFCLMPNHVHLLVQLREPNLGRGMQQVHRAYVRRFNDRHGRSGRLFEHRYNARLVADELYFVTVAAYIEQNPVKAGLSAAPEKWPWSSRGALARTKGSAWIADDVLKARRSAIAAT